MLAFILTWVIYLPIIIYLTYLAVISDTKLNRVLATLGILLGYYMGIIVSTGLNTTAGVPTSIIGSLVVLSIYLLYASIIFEEHQLNFIEFIEMQKAVGKDVIVIGRNFSTYPREESIDKLNNIW